MNVLLIATAQNVSNVAFPQAMPGIACGKASFCFSVE
jgi:hypothetical protein